MARIESFRDLDVYRMALREAKKLYLITQNFPREERYSLIDQIRRSSRAVNALTAEAWSRRKYKAAFISKIYKALGESMETQAWLDHAQSCNYIDSNQYNELNKTWQHIGGKLNRMIQRANTFVLKEEQ